MREGQSFYAFLTFSDKSYPSEKKSVIRGSSKSEGGMEEEEDVQEVARDRKTGESLILVEYP